MTTRKATQDRPKPAETADELLNVAERMFARDGIENVALASIVSASRQKNRSALHYYFGSRDGLLKAVLDRRLSHINRLRHQFLDEERDYDLKTIVRAIVAPIGEIVLKEPWGVDYISLLAQLVFRPLPNTGVVEEDNLSSVRRCRQLIERLLPEVPAATIGLRFRWLRDSITLAIARWSRGNCRATRNRDTMDDLVAELIRYGIDALSVDRKPARAKPRKSSIGARK